MTSRPHFSFKNSQAFSLPELLVVISVIGIIASLALPNLSDITNRAYFSKNERNAQNVANLLASARAAGAPNQWQTVDAALNDLEATLRVKVGSDEVLFSVPPFSPEQRTAISRYLAVDSSSAMVYYTGPAGN